MLQEGFEDWQPIIQQPKTTFIVKALQSSTCYQFRVLACNQYGAGQPSEPSDTITTKGRGWLASSPSNSRRREGESVLQHHSPTSLEGEGSGWVGGVKYYHALLL